MDDPCVWAPGIHMGHPDEASGFWLQRGPVLAIVAIWGVNQGTEDVFLCPLSHCDSSIHTNQSKGKK